MFDHTVRMGDGCDVGTDARTYGGRMETGKLSDVERG